MTYCLYGVQKNKTCLVWNIYDRLGRVKLLIVGCKLLYTFLKHLQLQYGGNHSMLCSNQLKRKSPPITLTILTTVFIIG